MIERDFNVPFVTDLARPTWSYRLAAVRSAARVSVEAGNSPQMVFRHYRELVTEKEAQGWFAVTPEAARAVKKKLEKERMAKIVTFPGQAAA
jgi:archaeosine-15-forming tRNA-guanine transglycosylase